MAGRVEVGRVTVGVYLHCTMPGKGPLVCPLRTRILRRAGYSKNPLTICRAATLKESSDAMKTCWRYHVYTLMGFRGPAKDQNTYGSRPGDVCREVATFSHPLPPARSPGPVGGP